MKVVRQNTGVSIANISAADRRCSKNVGRQTWERRQTARATRCGQPVKRCVLISSKIYLESNPSSHLLRPKLPVASCLDCCSSPCDLPAWPLPHGLAARRIQIKSGCFPSVLRTLKGFPASLRGKGRPVRPYKHCLPTPHGPQH